MNHSNKIFLALCGLLLLLWQPDSNAQTSYSYGTSASEVFRKSAVNPADNSFLTGGFENTTVDRGLLVNISNTGAINWAKEYAYAQSMDVKDIHMKDNGNAVVLFWTLNTSASRRDALLMEVDNSGTVLWSKSYVNTSYEVRLRYITALSSGSYILTGNTSINTSTSFTNYHLVMMKVDAVGNTVWVRRDQHSGGTANISINEATESADGNLLVSGHLWHNINGNGNYHNGYIAKIDVSDGSVLWNREYPNSVEVNFYQLEELANGDIVVAGILADSNTAGFTTYRQLFLKVKSTGTVLVAKEYDFPDVGNASYSFKVDDSTGNLFFVGVEASTNTASDRDNYWLELTDDGTFVNGYKYTLSNYEGVPTIEVNDFSINILTTTKSFSADPSATANNDFAMFLVDRNKPLEDCNISQFSVEAADFSFGALESVSLELDGEFTLTESTIALEVGEPLFLRSDICLVEDPLTIAGTSSDGDCEGEGSIDITVTGGEAPFAFSWSNTEITEDIIGLNTGTYTVTVTDNKSDTATATFTVTSEDTTPPVALCQPGAVYLDGSGTAFVDPLMIDAGSSDNCGEVTFEIENDFFTCEDVGTTQTVYLYVTDMAGNTDVCETTVDIIDNISPTALCKDITVQLDATGNAIIDASMIDAGSSDACGIFSMDLDITTFDCSNVGPNTVTLFVTDPSGGTSICTSTVTVDDKNIGPMTVDAVVTNIPCDGTGGSIDLTVTGGLPNYIFDWSNFMEDEDLTDITTAGTYNVIITDACGNQIEQSFEVTQEDCCTPSWVCPNDICVIKEEEGCEAIVTYDLQEELCEGQTLTLLEGFASGAAFPLGTTTVTYELNTGSELLLCSFEVTVGNYTPLTSDFDTSGIAASIIVPGEDTCFELTTSTGSAKGAIWYQRKLDLSYGFKLDFDIYLGDRDGILDGADGMMFILQPLSTDIGGTGGALGFSGVAPSVGIEFDTWQNDESQYANEPVEDHIAIQKNGDLAHDTGGYLDDTQQVQTVGEMEDGAYHHVQITWNADSHELTYVYENSTTQTVTQDIVNTIFGGDPYVYWGWAAGTGSAYNSHRVCVNDVTFVDAITADATITDVPCEGEGMIDLTVSGGIPGYTFQWSTAADAINEDLTGITEAGDYTVTITDACGNTVVETFTVEQECCPSITCPSDIYVTLDGNGCEMIVDYEVDAVDCEGAATVTLISGLASGASFPLGTTVVTYELSNGEETITCSFNVNVSTGMTLYGIVGDYLVSFDTNTGDATQIAPLSITYNRMTGLTYHEGIGELLAVANSGTQPKLISIDRVTGTVTEIGNIDEQSPFLDIRLMEAMQYNPNDGLLYGAGYNENPGTANWYHSKRLMTIDPLTGNATYINDISGTCNNEADMLGFGPGVTYLGDGCPNPTKFYTIDVATGVSTIIGSATGYTALAVQPISGLVYSLGSADRELLTISTTDATLVTVGTTHTSAEFDGDKSITLAFAPTAVASMNATAVVTDIPCEGEGGIIDLTVTGGVADYTFQWSNNSTDEDLTGITEPGDYFVIITDACGNQIEQSFEIIEEGGCCTPTLTCPNDITVEAPAGECSTIVEYELPSIIDACEEYTVELIIGQASGTYFLVGTTNIVYEITDATGIVSICEFSVTVTSTSNTTFISPWERHEGQGLINLSSPYPTTHGDPTLFDNYAVIPSVNDPAWYTAPVNSQGQIDMQDPSDMTTCFTQVDFTYFQTSVSIPANMTINTFNISFVAIDDGVRPYVFNSVYPNGAFVPGSGSTSANVDLSPYVIAGEVNRIVVAQMDDCRVLNTLVGAEIEVNGLIAPLTCECNIEAAIFYTGCNGQETCDPSDDTYSIMFGAQNISGGPSNQYSVYDVTNTSTLIGNYNYGDTDVLTLTGQAGISLLFVDFDNSECDTIITTGEFQPCLSECPLTLECPDDINATLDGTGCDVIVDYNLETIICPDATLTLLSGLPSGSAFPLGTTVVSYELHDSCNGATLNCSFNVNVSNVTPAPADYTPSGSAVAIDDENCYRLTTATTDQSGSIFYDTKMNLDYDFDLSFDINLGSDSLGADGMAFILQPISSSLTSTGGNIGYGGINPSVAIEFDTYRNNVWALDPYNDHISFQKNGVTKHNTAGYLDAAVSYQVVTAEMEDGNYHSVEVSWRAATKELTYIYDNTYTQTVTQDIANTIFGSNPNVFWGWSAATGSRKNEHTVCINSVSFVEGLTVDADIIDVPCNGLGAIDLTVSGGVPGYTFQWSDNSTNEDLSPITMAGDYTVTITDACGHSVVQTYTVEQECCPSLTCPSDIYVTLEGGCEMVVDYEVDAEDCDGTATVTLINGLASGATFPLGTTVVTYEITNGSTTTQCSFNVNVSTGMTLYGIVGNYLVSFDPATGDATEIAELSITYNRVTGLTYHEGIGELLAVANGTTQPKLISINRVTGTVTEIGNIDEQSPFLDIRLMEAMQYNPNDGLLYGSGYDENPANGSWYRSVRLMTIDPLTGNGTYITNISGTCDNEADILGFGPGVTYAADGCPPTANGFYTIDVATGVSTSIGNAPASSFGGLAVQPISGIVYSLGSTDRELLTISTTDATLTTVGTTHTSAEFDGGKSKTLAFAPTAIAPMNATAVVTDIPCDETGGIIDLTVTGGVPGYTYQWTGGSSNEDLTDITTAGSYLVIITDACGNQIEQSFDIAADTCQCKITSTTLIQEGCENMGTSDTSDDIITIFVNATVDNGSGNFNVVDGSTILGTFAYGTGGFITIPYATSISLIYEDAANPECNQPIAIDIMPCEYCTDLNINIEVDNYPKETTWELVDANGNVIQDSNGHLGQNPDGTVFDYNFCLPDGCYEFIIYDSYGDGICCDPFYGDGEYTITDMTSGTVLGQGGSFGSSETTSFCFGDTAPVSCTYETLKNNTFEGGWGYWVDGGEDAERMLSPGTVGNWSIRLRDNTSESTMTSKFFDLTDYTEATVGFAYRPISMDNASEDFFLEISLDGGVTFSIVEEWNQGDEFVNGRNYTDVVVIPGPFSADTHFRFRCDAGGDGDYVFIDRVTISGCKIDTESSEAVAPVASRTVASNIQKPDLAIAKLYPNPAHDYVNIDMKSRVEGEVGINIYTTTGQMVHSATEYAYEGRNQFTVNLDKLSNGTYMVEINDGKKTDIQRLVIMK